MAKCSFEFSFTGSRDALFEKMKAAIENERGEMDGNAESGTIKIPVALFSVQGNYAITEQSIRIEITKKPPLTGCERIENSIRSYLSESE